MRQAPVEREQTPGGQIERPSERSHTDVASNGLDRDSSFGPMSRNARMRLERGQDNAEVIVLHERLGVLAARRLEFTLELFELSREIELQKGSGHRLRVRSPAWTMIVLDI
jgi:hypothetical protein